MEIAGEAFRACRDLQHQIERLQEEMDDTIRIACAPVHMAQFLAVALWRFEESTPYRVEVTLATSETFRSAHAYAEALTTRKVDAVVTVNDLPHCAALEMHEIHLMAVLPPDDPDRGRAIPLTALSGRTVFVQDDSVWSRRALDAIVSASGIALDVVTEPLPGVCIALARRSGSRSRRGRRPGCRGSRRRGAAGWERRRGSWHRETAMAGATCSCWTAGLLALSEFL